MNKLTELYTRMLQSLDCKVEEDGRILIRPDENSEYVPARLNIEGKEKQLVMPFKHVQRGANWDECVAFHPACEVAFNGQSEVLNWIVSLMNLKLYKAVQISVITFLSLAADKAKHDKVRVTVRKMFSELPEVTPTTIKYLSAIIRKSTGVIGERPLLSLKLYRGRAIDGVKYNKTCRLITPILEEKENIYGIKASGKNTEAILAAYRIIFPTTLEVGTNSNEAGYLEALVAMYNTAVVHLNDLQALLGKYSRAMAIIDNSWMDEFANMQKYRKQFLNQSYPGNTGYPLQSERKEIPGVTVPAVAMPKAIAPAPAPRPTSQVIPTAAPAPVVNRGQMAVAQAPIYQQPTMQPVDPNAPMTLQDRMRLQRGIVPPVTSAPMTMNYIQPSQMTSMSPPGVPFTGTPTINPYHNPYMPPTPAHMPPTPAQPPRPVSRGDLAVSGHHMGMMGR